MSSIFDEIKEKLEEKFVSEENFRGRGCWMEAISIVEEVKRQYNEDVCEWEVKCNYYVTSCNNSTDIMCQLKDNYIYCPYCGKKIKVVE